MEDFISSFEGEIKDGKVSVGCSKAAALAGERGGWTESTGYYLLVQNSCGRG